MRRLINLLIFRLKNPTCHIGRGSIVSRKTKAGKNCSIGRNCCLSSTVTLGDNVVVGGGSILTNLTVGNNSVLEGGIKMPGTMRGFTVIGKECYIGVNNVFDTSGDIVIGDHVHIAGPSTGLWCHSSADMALNSIALNAKDRDSYRPVGNISISDNVYIGGNCSIYPGVSIADHVVVAPNSAVNRDVASYSMVGGVPAVFIKKTGDREG